LPIVNQPAPSNCEICFATVSEELMHFHRDWHAVQGGRGQQSFAEFEAETELDTLVRLVASLRSVPAVSSSPQFVNRLREHLTAEVFAMAIDPIGPSRFAELGDPIDPIGAGGPDGLGGHGPAD
jgi:hypothetical protein